MHVLGGGSKNRLLNQFCSNAMQIPVVAGPAEATSIGNAMVQLMALGEIGNHEQARRIVAESAYMEYFEPNQGGIWNEQFEKYNEVIIGHMKTYHNMR